MSLQAVAPENVPGEDGFFPAASDSKWYESLERYGSCNITDGRLPVPEVKDDDLSILYRSNRRYNREAESKVVSVIEGVLGDPGDEHRQWMDMVKKWFVKDVDFEFVPLGNVFLHYLFSISTAPEIWEGCPRALVGGFTHFRESVTEKIFKACAGDGEDGESASMLTTLFNILDPRGRTFLHTVFESMEFESLLVFWSGLHYISPSIKAKCLDARDGAGRSIFHILAIHYPGGQHWLDWCIEQSRDGNFFLKECSSSPQDEELNVLKQWCFSFEYDLQHYHLTAIGFAILVNATTFINSFLPLHGSVGESVSIDEVVRGNNMKFDDHITSVQLAALLGRTETIEHLLKHHTMYNSVNDPGLGNGDLSSLPAIHWVAKYGQVKAIQSILKFSIHDPMVQHFFDGTALHLLLDNRQSRMNLDDYHSTLLCHTLPN